MRNHFITFRAPEELTSDGGPEYTSVETEEFLNKWRVNHRLMSAYNPRANLRAELGVKVAKRLLRENVRNDGSLDTDKVARALLTHRNTPCKELKMSPAQLLFGRNLRDHLPAVKGQLELRKEWMMNQQERERALAHRYSHIEEKLEQSCRNLKDLEIEDHVQVQNRHGN